MIRKAGIISCSNGQPAENEPKLRQLAQVLAGMGTEAVFSPCVYAREGAGAGSAKERAAALTELYCRGDIDAIFDVSGGDMANELLPYLDFDLLARHHKELWGYSDLTVLLNALCAECGGTNVLYQVRNLVRAQGEAQQRRFADMLAGGSELFALRAEFVCGEELHGIAAGGNIRCLLKLAGTPYWPDFTGKVLLLEANSGREPQLRTYLAQLKLLGAFDRAAGVLLGTFTEMNKAGCGGAVVPLVREYLPAGLPLARTLDFGHGADARAVRLGAPLDLYRA